MKRFPFALGLMLATAVPFLGITVSRFDQKLSKDQRIVHALNRLTFGPRPSDVERVRRMGVEKWIDLQLHPERIPENPVLAAKLEPLETVQMTTPQIFAGYGRAGVPKALKP